MSNALSSRLQWYPSSMWVVLPAHTFIPRSTGTTVLSMKLERRGKMQAPWRHIAHRKLSPKKVNKRVGDSSIGDTLSLDGLKRVLGFLQRKQVVAQVGHLTDHLFSL